MESGTTSPAKLDSGCFAVILSQLFVVRTMQDTIDVAQTTAACPCNAEIARIQLHVIKIVFFLVLHLVAFSVKGFCSPRSN